MSKFALTAQLQIQAPKNVRQVADSIQKQLNNVSVNVSVKNSTASQRQLGNLNKQVEQLNSSGAKLGKTFGVAINRFAAFTVASRAVSLFTNSLANATQDAIDFEREMVKISQVTGKTMKELSGLSSEISRLATTLGTSSTELLSTTRILAQAGIQANDLKTALDALAKTTLAPTFENIEKTAEGAVAILAQFGQGVGALEKQLGAINAVAGQFAVESGDLISAVRRTGGVFKAAGGDLNELLALFTSVRATTRESAESIATGLRTIFTRIQRPATIEYLKEFGVQLTDLNGKFVGPYEAVRQLSNALAGLEEGDIRFVQIAEQLGGFRQIGKVIPLLQQFETAERARQAALEGGDSLTRDAATAQKALGVQITKVKEEFLALVRSISQTGSFQVFVKTTLDLASALISVADALKPIIPLLTAFAGIKLAKGIAGFGKGLGAGLSKNTLGFNSGGLVPGTGNRDTVPAMLTPGEFVIRKSSVAKMGTGTLAQMNNNKYFSGGKISKNVQDVTRLSAANKGLVFTRGVTRQKDDSTAFKRGTHQFTENDQIEFNTNVIKKPYKATKKGKNGEPPTASQQGKDFEQQLVEQGDLDNTNKSRFGGNEALDGKSRNGRLAEVKRTASNVSAASYADKMLRDQLDFGGKLITSPLTADKNKSDKIKLPDLDIYTAKALGGMIQKFAGGGNVRADQLRMGDILSSGETVGQKMKVGNRQRRQIQLMLEKDGQSRREKVDLDKMFNVKTRGKDMSLKLALGGIIQKFGNGGGATGTTNKTKGMTLEEAAASGLKRSQLVSGFDKSTVDSFFGGTSAETQAASRKAEGEARKKKGAIDSNKTYGAAFLEKITSPAQGTKTIEVDGKKIAYDLKTAFVDASDASKIKKDIVKPKALEAVNQITSIFAKSIKSKPDKSDNVPNLSAITGSLYEAGLARVVGGGIADDADDNRIFDFSGGLKDAAGLFGPDGAALRSIKTDAKATSSASALKSIRAKVKNDLSKNKFAKGGAAPSDTVPALLTPGEFVINKGAASKIGKANLDRMNKHGVQGFASGGYVGGTKVQKLNRAGEVRPFMGISQSSPPPLSKPAAAPTNLYILDIMEKHGLAVEEDIVVQKEHSDQTKKSTATEKKQDTLKQKVNRGLDKFSVAVIQTDKKLQRAFDKATINGFKKSVKDLVGGGINKLKSGINKLKGGFKSLAASARMTGKRLAVRSGKSGKLTTAAKMAKANGEEGEGKEGGGKGLGIFFAAQSLMAFIPQVEGATEGLGAMQNAASEVVMQAGAVVMIANELKDSFGGLGKVAQGAAIAGAAVYSLGRMVDAYTGVHLKAKKAIEEGNVAKAGETAVASKNASAATSVATGLAGIGGAMMMLGGPVGMIAGGLLIAVGAITKLVAATGALDGMFNWFRDNIGVWFGMDTTSLIKERAEAEAAAAFAAKEMAENTRRASEFLKDVASGDETLQGGFDNGTLTANLTNLRDVVKQRGDEVSTQRAGLGKAKRSKLATDATADMLGGTEAKDFAKTALLGPSIAMFAVQAKGAALIMQKMADSRVAGAMEKVTEASKKRIEATRAVRKEMLSLVPHLIKIGRASFVAGGSLEDFTDMAAKNLGAKNFASLDPEVQNKLLKNYKANIQAVAENTAAFAAANLGLRPIETIGAGLEVSMNRVVSVLDGSFSSLGSSVSIVGAALSGAAVDQKTFKTSLKQVNNTLNKFGVAGATIGRINKTFSTLRTASAGFNDALSKVQDKVVSDSLGGVSVKDAIVNEISNLDGLDDEGKKIIKNLFGTINLSPEEILKLETGDFSAILDKLDQAGAKAFEGVQKALEKIDNAEKALVTTLKSRAEAENKMINAQRKSIDLQEEAAGVLSSIGRGSLSSSQKGNFETARLSSSLRGGVGSSGDFGGIMARINSIQSGVAGSTGRLSGVASGGAGGDRREMFEDSQTLKTADRELNALISFSKKRISLYQEELSVVRKKNSLEKSALEKLVSGDTSGFIEAQAAASAQNALLSGDAGLASQFSGEAVGKALTNILEGSFSDAQKRTATKAGLGGFGSQRNVGVLTGSTSEENQIKSAIEQQATILQALAPAIEQLGSAEFGISSAGATQATNLLATAQKQAAENANKHAAAMKKSQDAAEAYAYSANAQTQELNGMIDATKAAADAQYEAEARVLKAKEGESVKVEGNIVNVDKVKNKANGGMIYANNGMFVPRGTDTVPAMLTPGEFVVNRSAVQRGNNLQVLRAMNTNKNTPSAAMSQGGTVYRSGGSTGPESGGSFGSEALSAAAKSFDTSAKLFSEAVGKLQGFKLNVKLDPTVVTVDLAGASFLGRLKEDIKNELLGIVGNTISGASQNFVGDINVDQRQGIV